MYSYIADLHLFTRGVYSVFRDNMQTCYKKN